MPLSSDPEILDPVNEDEDDDPEERKKRHVFLVLWWGHLLGTTIDRLSQLTSHLASGNIDTQEWADLFRTEMESAHGEATVIGRRLAGESGPVSGDDVVAGKSLWNDPDKEGNSQEDFLQGFIEDLENADKRYVDPETGEIIEKAVNQRSKTYAQSMKGSVNKGFVKALGQEGVNWIDSGDEKECDDCPGFAEASPWKPQELPTIPGAGLTQCLFNCRCYLETEDGKYNTFGIGTMEPIDK